MDLKSQLSGTEVGEAELAVSGLAPCSGRSYDQPSTGIKTKVLGDLAR